MGKIVSVYGYLTGLGTNSVFVSLPAPPFNSASTYSLIPVYNGNASPYIPMAAMWIYATGTVRLYKTLSVTAAYVSGDYYCT